MTFLQIRQRVAELMGVSSSDTTADDNDTMSAKLKAWVNARYKVLAAKQSWNWLIKDFIIQTVVDITTGTVSATNNNTTITFSSAPANSVTGYFIRFDSVSKDWYEISAHTAAMTSATLTVPFLGTTASGLSYTLRKTYYTLPSDAGKILDLRQVQTIIQLRYIPVRQLDRMISDRTRTGKPEWYTISGLTSARLYKMELYPVPNEAINIQGRYYVIVSDMTSDNDIPILPEAYHEILVWDVLSTYGYMFLDDTRISAAKAEYNSLYADMKRNHVDTEDIATRLAFDIDLTQVNLILRQLNVPIVP